MLIKSLAKTKKALCVGNKNISACLLSSLCKYHYIIILFVFKNILKEHAYLSEGASSEKMGQLQILGKAKRGVLRWLPSFVVGS